MKTDTPVLRVSFVNRMTHEAQMKEVKRLTSLLADNKFPPVWDILEHHAPGVMRWDRMTSAQLWAIHRDLYALTVKPFGERMEFELPADCPNIPPPHPSVAMVLCHE